MDETRKLVTPQEAIEALIAGEVINETSLSQEVLETLSDIQIPILDGRLTLPEDELLQSEVLRLGLSDSTKTWLKRLDVVASTASTNTDLLERANSQNINGHILTAEVQLAGRGRRGRQWVSPFGKNLMVSIGAVVDQPPANIGSISLAIGVGLANAIESLGINDVQLKWPNDVLIEGQKVCGILVEMADAKQPVSLVVGMGINVHAAPGEEVTGSYRATCLSEHVSIESRNQILMHVIDEVVLAILGFEKNLFADYGGKWRQRDYLLGKTLVVTETEHNVRGIGKGIDQTGAYLVETQAGLERIVGGTIRIE